MTFVANARGTCAKCGKDYRPGDFIHFDDPREAPSGLEGTMVHCICPEGK